MTRTFIRTLSVLSIALGVILAPSSLANASPARADFDGCPALGNEPAQVFVWKDSVYGRSAPDGKAPTSTRLLRGQCFFGVGRDKKNGFLLVSDGASKVWVFGGDVVWRGDLQKLPYLDDFRATDAVLTTRPQGLPVISAKARRIYANAAEQGRDLGIVSVIGDCNSESPVYFGRVATGSFNLGAYPSLQYAAGRFGRSWGRASLATAGSFNTSSALDPAWANPALCNGEAPLPCELRLSRASIMIMALGTGDQFAWQGIESRYRPIIENAIAGGVLPVLMTKADQLEHIQGGAPADAINNTIRGLGAQYGIPVIDFALGVHDLPNGGLANEPAPQFHLSTAGEDMRIIMTLATLGAISAGIAYVPPAEPVEAVEAAPVVSGTIVQAAPATNPVLGEVTVTHGTAVLRKEANFEATEIGRVFAGQKLSMFSKGAGEDWIKVAIPGSSEQSWIHTDQITIAAVTSTRTGRGRESGSSMQ